MDKKLASLLFCVLLPFPQILSPIFQPAPASGGGPAAFVQEKDVAVNSSTPSITFGSNVTAGNTVVCSAGYNGATTITVTSVKDGTNASFSVVDAIQADGGNQGKMGTYVLANSAGGASASAITLTLSATPTEGVLQCQEWSGVPTSSPVDVHAIASPAFGQGTGANAWSSGAQTTTGADGCAGFVQDTGGSTDNWAAGTTVAWTGRANPGKSYLYSESFVQSGSGSIAATFGSANGGNIYAVVALVCLKP